jgi:hypothetical protein
MSKRSDPSDGKSAASPSAPGTAKRVDPRENRPANAEEMAPESLIPDVTRSHLERIPRDQLDRFERIQRHAHALAAKRGFEPGREIDDWLQAERDIDGADGAARPENQFTG